MSSTERLILFIFVGVFSLLQALSAGIFAYRLKLNPLLWSVTAAAPLMGIFALLMLGEQVRSVEKADSENEKSFQHLALRFRLRTFLLIAGMILWLFVGGSALSLLPIPKMFILILWLAGGAVIIAKLHPLLPDCPHCQKNLGDLFGNYCPECLGTLLLGDSRTKASCSSCGKTLRNADGKPGRNFRIRGCSHCGVLLDKTGLK